MWLLLAVLIGPVFCKPYMDVPCNELTTEKIKFLASQHITKVAISNRFTTWNPRSHFLGYVPEMGRYLHQMEILRVDGCQMEDESWKRPITELRNIQTLEIMSADLTEFDFDWIASKELRELNLSYNKGVVLKGKSITKKLHQFICDKCNLSPASIETLKQFKNSLITLSLKESSIDEMEILESFPTLALLNSNSREDIYHKNFIEETRSSASTKTPPTLLILVLLGALFKGRFTKVIGFIIVLTFAIVPTQAFFVKHRNLPIIKSTFFKNFQLEPNTSIISIEYSKIVYVEYSAFGEFENLTNLSLVGNNLTTFHIESNKLQVLNLAHNKITNIDPKLFENSPHLTELYLEDNQISRIEWDLSFHSNLQKVLLNENRLEWIHLISPTLDSLWIKWGTRTVEFSPESELKQLTFLEATGTEIKRESSLCSLSDSELLIHVSEEDINCPKVLATVKAVNVEESSTSTSTIKSEIRKVGCDYTTMRINNIDDVVLTNKEYYQLVISFYILGSLIFLQMIGIIFVIVRYHRNLRNYSVKSKYEHASLIRNL